MRQMSKILISAAVMGLLLTGCKDSGKGGAVTAVPDELAQELSGTVSGDTLTAVSEEILASTYMVDTSKIEESAAYIGTGATACEAVVIKCTDDSYPADVKELFETRVENQSNLYASYNAAEVENLDNALIETSGNYAVLCVTNDTEAAKKILEEAGF